LNSNKPGFAPSPESFASIREILWVCFFFASRLLLRARGKSKHFGGVGDVQAWGCVSVILGRRRSGWTSRVFIIFENLNRRFQPEWEEVSMYSVLIRLMVLAALTQLGISFEDLRRCRLLEGLSSIEKASRKVLRVDWRPISVFPDEAKRFR
jgi:hypothetical protein